MKKISAIILALLILTSCTKAPESKETSKVEQITKSVQQVSTISSKSDNTNNQAENDNSYFGQYQMAEEGFSQYLKGNAIDRDYKIESDKFQKSSEFVNESGNNLGLGSQGRVQLAMSLKDRIRQRTLQLMEYYYMLGGEVEF